MKKYFLKLVIAVSALTGASTVQAQSPQIIVRGSSVTILNGDTTPTGGDSTAFFDVAVCGAASVTHTFTILNYGTESLNVTGIASSNPAEFQVGAPTFPIVIFGGGGWSTFSVTFDPNGPGPRTSTISIANNDSTANPYTFVVGGNGTGSANLVLICATNKTVNCGAAWSFDPPATTDSCNGTNVTLTVLSTVTTGVCPQAFTRTWQATDAFGTNTCSQTVTLLDTEPPAITCPTNRIIVALDANCQLEIPTIRPSASDNCTPASQLVYTQNPSAGAIVPGPCQLVTVTIRDACDNVSQCQVLVCGQDKTPPTLIYPKSVTVTNCLVPNVLALVSASDNCTASNQLVFTQSPPAGTPIAAGGNQVSVTVTDPNGNATTIIIPLTSSESFLNVMFNTGVDSNKAVLPGGSVDPHYTLGNVPAFTPTGPGFYIAPNAVTSIGQLGPPPYTFSRWIAPYEASQVSSEVFFTCTNKFVLPPGADPLTASISGRWSVMRGGKIYLNGLAPSNQISSVASWLFSWSPPPGSTYWTYFTANSGFLGFPATNTLYFVHTNQNDGIVLTGGIGLRVEFTDAAANCSTCTPPVILHKTRDQSLPLNSTAVFSVSVWGTPPLTLQWYHNGLPLTNGVHYPNGVTNTTLTITPLGYADAGIYTVAVSNSCGGTASVPAKLTITRGWPWPWAWWNFSQIENPLAAVVGPPLIMEGTNIFGFSFGTTFAFGLPNIGGQSANVIHVASYPDVSFIRMPFVGSPDGGSVSNYTVIMDILVPSDSTAPAKFLDIFDRWGNIAFTTAPTPAGEVLSLGGTVGGTPFNLNSTMPLSPGKWNRIALVAGILGGVVGSGTTDAAGFTVYVNGELAGSTQIIGTSPAITVAAGLAVFSSPEGTEGELYAASLQFHAVAFTPEMIASIGDPNNGPIPVNDPSMSVMPPVLSVNMSPNGIKLTWVDPIGGAFFLEGTSDLGSGEWMELMLPFEEEADVSGTITFTATVTVKPSSEGPGKFYRLKINNYIGHVTLIR